VTGRCITANVCSSHAGACLRSLIARAETTSGPPATLVVELFYSRSEWLCCHPDGAPFQGGYLAHLPGFADRGVGETPEQALGNLAQRLREWVEAWDAEADVYARSRSELDRVNRYSEPELLKRLRPHLQAGTLLHALRLAATHPVLNAASEPDSAASS
jgi:hypothetical protein